MRSGAGGGDHARCGWMGARPSMPHEEREIGMASANVIRTISIGVGSVLAAGLMAAMPAAAGSAPRSGSDPGAVSAEVTAADIGAKSCNKIAGTATPSAAGADVSGGPFAIGRDYVRTFYPRWFTYYQAEISPCNKLLGPRRVTPTYRAVVAINVDTVYTSSTIDVSQGPVIVTVPAAETIFSVLQLDGYGTVLSGIPSNTPGTYAITGPSWTGTLPAGVTEVRMPYDTTIIIFRADKYTVDGVDKRQAARTFRTSLRLAPLSDYLNNPDAGPPRIVPSAVFGAPFKTAADQMVTKTPRKFVRQLQTALAARTTQPKTAKEAALAERFDTLFAKKRNRARLADGARAAHTDLVGNYLNGTLPKSQWVHFDNMGQWAATRQGYLDRSSITEYIQFGNNLSAAAYFQAFNDKQARTLNGRNVYQLKLRKKQIPTVKRFWSLTAYTPKTVELVRNRARKYVVASYTKNLVTAKDGSVTIVMANKRPMNTPKANWLPTPKGQFNVMLRAYGPEGDVANGDYTPPPVRRR